MASALFLQYTAKADVYLLLDSGETLFIGDSLQLLDYFDDEKIETTQLTSIQYTVAEESQDQGCIALTADGTVSAVKEGTAVIQITYSLEGDSLLHTEFFQVSVLPPEKLTATYGGTVWLTAFNMYNPFSVKEEGEEEQEPMYVYSCSGSSLVLDPAGEGMSVQGFTGSNVYLEKNGNQILVAEVTINTPKLQKKNVVRAAATKPYVPVIKNVAGAEESEDGTLTAEQMGVLGISLVSENATIAAITGSAISPVAEGETKITVKITAKSGEEMELFQQIVVTDPKYTGKPLAVAKGISKKLPITGTCGDSTYEYPEGQDGFTYSSLNGTKGKVRGVLKGTETVAVVVDGRTVKAKVIVTNPAFKENAFVMYKGLKKSISLSGINKNYSTVTYESANKAFATVTKAGKITAKKVGVVKMKIKADGKSVPVWVEISTKKGYQAANKGIAISKTKTQYSQARRMSAGYYDCSSLVSRVYRQYGVYFGSKSGWSPTAAEIGRWCVNHGKDISTKPMDYTKLVPGDLIFYSYTKNGRYRNISHVEIYAGNGMNISASSRMNKVVHYAYGSNCTVLVARPTP